MLYLVATPIGNLKDISQRALEILKSCDIIACEDTRRTLKLLNVYKIKKKLVSYHQHNEREAGAKLLHMAMEGKTICLVSDAGCPGISDPGEVIVKLFYENNMEVSVIPGANAALSALVLSGLDTGRFIFEGFLPSTGKKRRGRLKELTVEGRTMIFYEAPHRLTGCIKDMNDIFGHNRRAAVVKEITKIYEKTIRGTFKELSVYYEKNQPRGEFVIVVEGGKEIQNIIPKKGVRELYDELMEAGTDRKEALRIIAKQHNISRRDVYSKINKEQH